MTSATSLAELCFEISESRRDAADAVDWPAASLCGGVKVCAWELVMSTLAWPCACSGLKARSWVQLRYRLETLGPTCVVLSRQCGLNATAVHHSCTALPVRDH